MAKPVLGIVGGIGSGKSRVAAALAARGGLVIDADQLGHEALVQPAIRDQVIRRWGQGIVGDHGEVNRRALGKLVFADPVERQVLETLVFPWIERRITEAIQRGQDDPRYSFIIFDAAIMLETGWDRICDKIIFIDVPRELRLERLGQQRGWSEQELARREVSQMPLEEKKRRADAVLANTGEVASVCEKAKIILQNWGWPCEAGLDTAQ